MNRCFEKESRFNSNTRTQKKRQNSRISASASREKCPTMGTSRALALLYTFLGARLSARTIARIKAVVVAVSLVLFVGIIGAMERGALPFGLGLLLGAGILGAQVLCLRAAPEQTEE